MGLLVARRGRAYLVTCWARPPRRGRLAVRRRALHRSPGPLRSDRRRVVRLLQNGPDESGERHQHPLRPLSGHQMLSLDVRTGLDLRARGLDRFTIAT